MQHYPFVLQPLPYSYDALEPYIDRETMKIHHTKHHQTYVDNLNEALENYPEYHFLTLEELLKNLHFLPIQIQTKVRNNGGGVYNHNLFFNIMKPNAANEPIGILKKAIIQKFGSFETFKERFKKAALSRFGSGWAWLISEKNGDLQIITTPNQDSPVQFDTIPILPLDVWEHAYYLKYQNRRGDYIDNWFNVIDWQEVENNYQNVFK